MTDRYYCPTDPLILNGILPGSAKSLVLGDAPLYPPNYNPNLTEFLPKDRFISTRQKNDPNMWKSFVFWAVATIAGVIGVRKLFNLSSSVKNYWNGIGKDLGKKWDSFANWFKNLFKSKKP